MNNIWESQILEDMSVTSVFPWGVSMEIVQNIQRSGKEEVRRGKRLKCHNQEQGRTLEDRDMQMGISGQLLVLCWGSSNDLYIILIGHSIAT